MRTAITLTKTHAGAWAILGNPDDSLLEQKKNFRALRADKAHADLALAIYQESDGHCETIRFITPQKKEEQAAARQQELREAKDQAAANAGKKTALSPAPNEFTEASLFAKSKSELQTILETLRLAGRTTILGGSKTKLIEAILQAGPAPTAAPSADPANPPTA